MRRTALFFVLILATGASTWSGRRPEDVFKWISGHVQTVTYTVTTPMATYQEDDTAKVEFSGCSAKITEDLKTPRSNIRTTVSFVLRDIQADSIRSSLERGVGDTHVSEYFTVELPLASPAKNVTIFRTASGSKTDTSLSDSVYLVLPDQNMADRQVNAWRDASLSCGARN